VFAFLKNQLIQLKHGTFKIVNSNALLRLAKMDSLSTTKFADVSASHWLAQLAKSSSDSMKMRRIPLRSPSADVSALTKTALATSILTLLTANASANPTNAQQHITLTPNIASVSAKTPATAMPTSTGVLQAAAVNAIQLMLSILVPQTVINNFILMLKLAHAFAVLPQLVATLVTSGTTMSAIASAAQWSAQTTSTGTTSTVNVNANQLLALMNSTGTSTHAVASALFNQIVTMTKI
jgi:hypothetical protein